MPNVYTHPSMQVFLMCSILSLIFDGYFYCICLLHIIVNNDILQRVLKSVTKNGGAIMFTIHVAVIHTSLFYYHRQIFAVGGSSRYGCPLHLCCSVLCIPSRVISSSRQRRRYTLLLHTVRVLCLHRSLWSHRQPRTGEIDHTHLSL